MESNMSEELKEKIEDVLREFLRDNQDLGEYSSTIARSRVRDVSVDQLLQLFESYAKEREVEALLQGAKDGREDFWNDCMYWLAEKRRKTVPISWLDRCKNDVGLESQKK